MSTLGSAKAREGSQSRAEAVPRPERALPLLAALAPDLCPVEPVWGHMKGKALANWAPEDTDELEEAVHDHLAKLNHTPRLLRGCFAAASLRLMKSFNSKSRGQ